MRQILILLLVSLRVVAQDDYSNVDIGWKAMADPKLPAKPEKFDRWSYSAVQMQNSTLILSWMQQTYTPRGCFGAGRRLGNTKPDLYDSTVIAEPMRYGAVGRFYHDVHKTPTGKWEATSNEHHFMRIAVNGNIGQNLKLISTPQHHYFILPNMDKGSEDYDRRENLFGFRTHPMISKYPHFLTRLMNAEASGYTIVMNPGGGLPYHQVTKGEYLLRLKEAIARIHAEELRKIARNYPEKADMWNKIENEKFTARMAAFDRIHARYKDRRNEPATLATEDGTYLVENESGNDIFTPTPGTPGTPVYAFNADKVAKCKSDTAQWIVVTWTDIEADHEKEVHFMKTILDRFDFDYLYNYFFDPEKVKGRDYAPLGAHAAATVSASPVVKPANKEPGVFYSEDFSGVAAGMTPANWRADRNAAGDLPIAVTLNGREGQWLRTNGQVNVSPKDLSYPLPADFELSFEVAAPKDINWGAKAFELALKTDTKGSNVDMLLRLRAGFSGRAGEFSLNDIRGEIAGFSNDKDVNTVRVKLIKKGNALECFFNELSVANIPNTFATAARIQRLFFNDWNTSPTEVQRYFLKNLRIKPL